jgi:GNAT superfamily N-acetyltransferase
MGNVEINDYGQIGMTAKIDFKLQLINHPELDPILGRSDVTRFIDEFGQTSIRGSQAAFPMYQTGYYAFVPEELGRPVGFISIIDDAHPGHFTEAAKLQHIWIDRKYSGKRYGDRLLEIVRSAVLKTDNKCKSGELKEPCFSLCLFPRRFDFPADFDFESLVAGEGEYDVSVDDTTGIPKGIKSIDDAMITEFDLDHLLEHRKDLKQLVKFYKDRGFVQNKFFEIKTMMSKEGYYYREIGVMGVTFCSMLRTALVFPACNNEFWNAFSERMIEISGKTYEEAVECGILPCKSAF